MFLITMINFNQQKPPYFPRQVGVITLEFEDWASEVRQQMMNCLEKKRRRENDTFETCSAIANDR
jgi:hypothetical protein